MSQRFRTMMGQLNLNTLIETKVIVLNYKKVLSLTPNSWLKPKALQVFCEQKIMKHKNHSTKSYFLPFPRVKHLNDLLPVMSISVVTKTIR